MDFREIASRLTGFSIPVLGASWNPPEAEVTVVRRIVAFLEDRRVLYVPHAVETPAHCLESVMEIRRFLTSELGKLGAKSDLKTPLRSMRAASRKFLDATQRRPEIVEFGMDHGHWASWEFGIALGELRGIFGLWLGVLASRYRVDVEDELAVILPAKDSPRAV